MQIEGVGLGALFPADQADAFCARVQPPLLHSLQQRAADAAAPVLRMHRKAEDVLHRLKIEGVVVASVHIADDLPLLLRYKDAAAAIAQQMLQVLPGGVWGIVVPHRLPVQAAEGGCILELCRADHPVLRHH